ncbi:elongation factor 1-beta-like [Sturnira hondurensis]|uniref:elongation factor 1-beta-like n=1 Tax=Sturnira hondurensis TaxID=192404 RepID=UPI00187A1A52|nr:elongation factor 1-beta-like [Sturnira hondurensis]
MKASGEAQANQQQRSICLDTSVLAGTRRQQRKEERRLTGDLKIPAGLQALNNYLADKSYVERYVPSPADIAVFEAISGPPPADLYHALCWYNHIKSYEKEKASLPGVKKILGKYGPANVEDTTGSGATDGNDDDDDIDLFGSDEEEESEGAKRLREEHLAQYESKKAKKPRLVAKSSILLDVKPWDEEMDMVKLEECVRSIQANGLVWGASKLVPVGCGIKTLQIQCVVEDDKVGTDMLEERITAFEDCVQSMDVAAFNKV